VTVMIDEAASTATTTDARGGPATDAKPLNPPPSRDAGRGG
jgi:hypothetical protein